MSELKLCYRVATKMMENTKFEHELGIELVEVDDGLPNENDSKRNFTKWPWNVSRWSYFFFC